jgi:probable HAF family extracellular repeat protein
MPDPYGEDFCGYGTHVTCRAARWDFGFLTTLQTLGGSNATVGNVNNLGQVPGVAETSAVDGSCAASVPFQMLQYKPVIWDPGMRSPRQLALLAGDTVGVATVVNDRGQVVWTSSLAPDSRPFYKIHAFLWTRAQRMRDLGTLPGDVASVATNINDAGEVIGASADGSGNIRAFHWQRGNMEDLNTLVPEDSVLYLLFALAEWSRLMLLRTMGLNHWYQHRGELVVYLRLLGAAVPVVYGRSADENPLARTVACPG